MLRIRLTRRGAKKDPHYRVVVTEKSSPRDGRFVEIVGHYNPALQPVRLQLDLPRVDYWLEKGAQPSQTVQTLIRKVREQETGSGDAAQETASGTPEQDSESASAVTEEAK